MRTFNVASDEEIKKGATTDIYFVRTSQVLKAKGLEGTRVVAEVTAGGLPENWPWGVICGLDEVATLFEGCPVDVQAIPEGTIFHPHDHYGNRLPVIVIEGPYGNFCELETPMLGLICQASGVATMAARLRKLAWGKLLVSFGIRRVHPALSPMIDRAAYIGGFDGVSSLSGAKRIGKEPMGTMPHALIIVFGDQVKAWKAFDEVIPRQVNRVALVDTYFDEKAEAIMAAEALGKNLWGVRLDTPGSRRGNFAEIIREVRWELDLRGYRHVKILASGGINDRNITELVKAGVDGFGIGTSLSNAPTIDFAMDIVEINGRPVAKRGKLGGRKQVWRCRKCLEDVVLPAGARPPRCPVCDGKTSPLLQPLIKKGKIVAGEESVDKIRSYVLSQLNRIPMVD
ncbi:MAG: nicotinate phosphoribosyltransferase [Candidatus Hadarchaeum sp.]|uniref:nicotinate phosphoribosyltransferase n=1 Tax=Candidatus Hadarchaeum sp. TaxID=2883567 RepID=UPI003D137F2D